MMKPVVRLTTAVAHFLILGATAPSPCRGEQQKILDLGSGYSVTYHEDWSAKLVSDGQWRVTHPQFPEIGIYWNAIEGEHSNAELHELAWKNFIAQCAAEKIRLRFMITVPTTRDIYGRTALDSELAEETNKGAEIRHHLMSLQVDDHLLIAISSRVIGQDSSVSFGREMIGSVQRRKLPR